MICYRDRTFCSYKECSKWEECGRALTMKIKKDSNEFGLPICQFSEQPECYEDNKKDTK